MTDTDAGKARDALGLPGGGYWRGVIECAVLGDISRAVEVCETVCPHYEYTLKPRKASLRHDKTMALDVDWIRGKNTAEALILCCLKVKGHPK